MKFQKLVLAILIFSYLAGCTSAQSETSTPVPYASRVPLPTAAVTVLPREDRPNIILILTDDLDSKLGTINYMPNLQKLMIEHGLSMKDFFVTTPTCCPSRTTILRGQYTHNHQIYTSSAVEGFQKFYMLDYDSSTLATWLSAAGYQTIFLGKYLNGYPIRLDRTYVPQGWDEWYSPGRGKPYNGFNYTINANGVLVPYGEGPDDYLLDVLSVQMQAFLRDPQRVDAPFFMFFAPYQPHEPATPAARHATLFEGLQAPRTGSFNEEDVFDKPDGIKYDPQLTWEEIVDLDDLYRKRVQSMQAVDEMIAQLFAVLDETDQLDNTYIIFTSDNGFHLGQHRMIAGKSTLYEEDINVPFVIVGPDIPQNMVLDGYLVGNVDIAPTIADLAGVVPPPQIIDGRSMVPLFQSSLATVVDWRNAYLLEVYERDTSAAEAVTAVANEDEQGVLEPSDLDEKYDADLEIAILGLRSRDYLYVEYADGFVELYDLQADPHQLDNVAATADDGLLASLSNWLRELAACKTDSCLLLDSKKIP